MKQGYVMVLFDGKWVREHRLVWEQENSCCLLPWIHIHHKNGNRADNRIENLEPLSIGQHSRHHMPERGLVNNGGYHWTPDAKGRVFTDEHKKKIGNALRGKPKSNQHRRNIWKNRNRSVSEEQKQKQRKAITRKYIEMKSLGYKWTGKGWLKLD